MNICWTFLVLLPARWKQKVRLFISTWRLPSMAKKFDKAKKLSALCRTSLPAKAMWRRLENPTAKSDLIENLWGNSVEADIIVLKWIWKVLFSQRLKKRQKRTWIKWWALHLLWSTPVCRWFMVSLCQMWLTVLCSNGCSEVIWLLPCYESDVWSGPSTTTWPDDMSMAVKVNSW